MIIIFAKNIFKSYGSFTAVKGIDFEIKKGECFGFLGPNGAGKTTVMKMIQCYMRPTMGELKVFGLDTTVERSKIKSKLSVMPQENNLDNDLSVLENLIIYANYFDIKKRDAIGKIEELMNFFEISEFKNSKIENLSGGMKRKILLARALINDPELIILDEPTTGLDPHIRRNVWEKLNLLKIKGKTLVLTTHYMEEADYLCDRIALMDLGKIVLIGEPEKLKRTYNGNLEEVYLKLTGKKLET